MVVRDGQRAPPGELWPLDVGRGDRQLHAVVLYRADVLQLLVEARRDRDVDQEQEVSCFGVVRIDRERDAVVEERRIEPRVELGLLLPVEVGVGHEASRRHRRNFRGAGGVPSHVQLRERLVGVHRLAADLAVAHAQLQVAEERLMPHEGFVAEAPGERTRGEESPLVIHSEHARAVSAAGQGEELLVGDIVVGPPEKGEQRVLLGGADRRNERRP